MTFIKIIFLLILAMLERCHIVRREVVPLNQRPVAIKTNNYDDFQGSWQMDLTTHKATKGSPESLEKNPLKMTLLFSFFPDSTFTELHGTEVYRSGKYHLLSADSTIFMVVNDDVKKLHLSFETNSNNRRVMHLKNNRTGEEKRLFENAYPLKDYKEDPFYSANNEWRTKPALPQSKVQIQAKLADYVKHNCLILKAADDRNQRVISWEFSKGIIRFYNGGIGIVSPEYIPQSWIDTFHSRDEAMEAFAMFDAALRSNKYKGRKTANWLKDDYAILNATYHILKGNRELHQAVQ